MAVEMSTDARDAGGLCRKRHNEMLETAQRQQSGPGRCRQTASGARMTRFARPRDRSSGCRDGACGQAFWLRSRPRRVRSCALCLTLRALGATRRRGMAVLRRRMRCARPSRRGRSGRAAPAHATSSPSTG